MELDNKEEIGMEDISSQSMCMGKHLELNKKKETNHDEEEDELSVITLPDEMIEIIISYLKYPYIVKAKELSKEWYSKLSNWEDAEYARFRQMVTSNCNKWPIFFPCAFVDGTISLVGFDRLTGTWLKTFFDLPSLVTTKILNSIVLDSRQEQPVRKITGIDSLICIAVNIRKREIFILNVFTGNWKWLPRRPIIHETPSLVSRIDLFRDGSDHYKVLTMGVWRKYLVCAQLYESRTNSWTTEIPDFPASLFEYCHRKGVYLSGSMYFLADDTKNGFYKIRAYNIEEGTWHSLVIPRPLVWTQHVFSIDNLIVSQDRLIILSVLRLRRPSPNVSPSIRKNTITFFEIDTLTENLSEVWISHPHPSAEKGFFSFLCSKFFLQPGKNPFIVV
ncbi:hypothetical protein R1sor_009442 [Riccia sorocarpa]|uniref:F-box domain-containing protein n=1 Tax=Riccia sorocarpa TaxID=122646 RepID=A0ABD3HZ87_9MARC